MADCFEVGDVVFLQHEIAGLPYPTGYWVLCSINSACLKIALVGKDDEGLVAIDGAYKASIEDISAFKRTGETARIPTEGLNRRDY